MYIIYADESGDSGSAPGGTPFFAISGIIVHESNWNEIFQRFLDLRRNLSMRYQVPQRIPFHATNIINGHKEYHHSQFGLTEQQRFDFYRDILEFLAQLPEIRILNIFIRKDHITKPVDIFEWGWQLFIQRFHNFIDRGGHIGRTDEFGLLFTDRTHDDHLRRLMRRMRAFNYVPSQYPGSSARRVLVTRILDDPIPRASQHSYFVQMADLVAFALVRRDYQRKKLGNFKFETYFDILNPILLTQATQHDPQGIVYWPK